MNHDNPAIDPVHPRGLWACNHRLSDKELAEVNIIDRLKTLYVMTIGIEGTNLGRDELLEIRNSLPKLFAILDAAKPFTDFEYMARDLTNPIPHLLKLNEAFKDAEQK